MPPAILKAARVTPRSLNNTLPPSAKKISTHAVTTQALRAIARRFASLSCSVMTMKIGTVAMGSTTKKIAENATSVNEMTSPSMRFPLSESCGASSVCGHQKSDRMELPFAPRSAIMRGCGTSSPRRRRPLPSAGLILADNPARERLQRAPRAARRAARCDRRSRRRNRSAACRADRFRAALSRGARARNTSSCAAPSA